MNRKNPIDKHYDFQNEIIALYKQREKPGYMEKTIQACIRQINISKDVSQLFRKGGYILDIHQKNIDKQKNEIVNMVKQFPDMKNTLQKSLDSFITATTAKPQNKLPEHTGFKQLCIIYEKQGKYEDAIKYAEMAKIEGWNGDWDNRLRKIKKKM